MINYSANGTEISIPNPLTEEYVISTTTSPVTIETPLEIASNGHLIIENGSFTESINGQSLIIKSKITSENGIDGGKISMSNGACYRRKGSDIILSDGAQIEGNLSISIVNGAVHSYGTGGSIKIDGNASVNGSLELSITQSAFNGGVAGSIDIKDGAILNLEDNSTLSILNEPLNIEPNGKMAVNGIVSINGKVNVKQNGKIEVASGKILKNYGTIKLM